MWSWSSRTTFQCLWIPQIRDRGVQSATCPLMFQVVMRTRRTTSLSRPASKLSPKCACMDKLLLRWCHLKPRQTRLGGEAMKVRTKINRWTQQPRAQPSLIWIKQATQLGNRIRPVSPKCRRVVWVRFQTQLESNARLQTTSMLQT